MSTILQIAGGDKNLSILLKGLKAANLEEKFSGIGPFTILAPINLAFGKLPHPDTFENLIKTSKESERLSDILSYHVIKGKKMLKDFRDGQKLQTINGKELSVSVRDGEVRINGAMILTRDRQGSNGVVHSINAVNIPV